MLVLSRNVGEKVVATFGGLTLEIVVSEVRGDKVRLGFVGPREIAVHRKELLVEIERQEGKR